MLHTIAAPNQGKVMKMTPIALGLMVAASGAYAGKPVTEELPPEPTEPVIPT
jgi:hypothetical protein